MNKQQLHNQFTGNGELPINIPPPADAWNDMRKKLDDEMPEPGILLPANIITAGTGFINGITVLCTLLLAGSIAIWFGSSGIATTSKSEHGLQTIAGPGKKGNSNDPDNSVKAANPANETNMNDAKAITRTVPANVLQKKEFAKVGVVANKLSVIQNAMAAPGVDSFSIATQNRDNATTEINKNELPVKTDKAPALVAYKNNLPEKDSVTDSSGAKTTLLAEAGLQWKTQLPFSSAQNYFTGPDGSSQPYRILLPGIWLSVTEGRNTLTADINPFASTVYKPRPFRTGPPTRIKQLSKTFGITAAVHYDYNLQDRWWLGAGVQAYWFNKGLAFIRIDSAGTLNVAPLTSNDLANLSTFQLRADAELLYKSIRWQAGIRAGVYFTPLEKSYNTLKNPLEFELFFRRRLWSNRK